MALTYEPIATYTAGSDVADITFNTITGAYTDLVVSVYAISGTTNNPTILLTFNNDSGSNYSGVQMYWRSTGVAGGNKNLSANYISIGRATGLDGNVNGKSAINLYVMDYSNSSKYKGIIAQTSNYFGGVEVDCGTWASTAAITTVNLNAGPSGWKAGTVYTLYGIKAA